MMMLHWLRNGALQQRREAVPFEAFLLGECVLYVYMYRRMYGEVAGGIASPGGYMEGKIIVTSIPAS
jgi:hypothetical protein